MSNKTISLCMIVKDEEKSLATCLKSVKDIVDEIIVVDTGSKDKTVEIAKKYGAKVYCINWVNDFSKARNFSIKHATSDYILVMDADEYLDGKQSLKQDIVTNKDCYTFQIKNIKEGNTCFYHRNIRLFKNNMGIQYEYRLHEQIVLKDSLTQGKVKTIIIHTGYLEEVMVEKDKYTRNYELMSKELKENPSGVSYYNMGRIYYEEKEYTKAIEMFNKSYPLAKGKKYFTTLLYFLCASLYEDKQIEQSIQLLKNAINIYTDYIDLYYLLGGIYKKINYLEDAETCYKKCLETANKKRRYSQTVVEKYMAYYKLAELYNEQGRLGEAFINAKKGLMENEKYSLNLLEFIKAMLQSNASINDTMLEIMRNCDFEDVEQNKTIIAILYDLRHPLLGQIVTEQHKVDTKEFAVLFQYSKKYKQAYEIWNNLKGINEENVYDIIVLLVVLQDTKLLNKINECINLSKKDWVLLKKIVLREKITVSKITLNIEYVLLKICENLIILEEYEVFEYITDIIKSGSKEVQYNLAVLLNQYGFVEVAKDMVIKIIEEYPEYIKPYTLLSRININQELLDDALNILLISQEQTRDYEVYSQLYKIYKFKEDQYNMRLMGIKIKRKFPLAFEC